MNGDIWQISPVMRCPLSLYPRRSLCILQLKTDYGLYISEQRKRIGCNVCLCIKILVITLCLTKFYSLDKIDLSNIL